MQLSISDQTLNIDLDGWEQLWAFYFNADLKVPLAHITEVSTELPASDWREVRLPGTFLPGVIKAGTYYTPNGREFWYVTQRDRYLTLKLENEFYNRIVLAIDDNLLWAERIRSSTVNNL
jgi:hypothetical protein